MNKLKKIFLAKDFDKAISEKEKIKKKLSKIDAVKNPQRYLACIAEYKYWENEILRLSELKASVA